MRASFAICALAILVTACAADTMRGYIGQDIRAVQLDTSKNPLAETAWS